MKKIYYTILIFIFFQSCAPIKTVVDTSCSGYKKENFKREFTPEMKLGIMPVQCQIWDTEIGDVVWEGKGGTAKLPEDNTNIIEKTAEGLSKTVGNIANYGACEDKQTLINSTQQASNNTEEVIIMISTILSLIIIFSI